MKKDKMTKEEKQKFIETLLDNYFKAMTSIGIFCVLFYLIYSLFK